jgi:hypothetical protein
MPGFSRRGNEEARPKHNLIGVRKLKDFLYEGWRITVLQRDQGVQTSRIAYSARVTNLTSKVSFYIHPADNQKLVIKNAKNHVDQQIEKSLRAKPKYETIEKVLNLWFRDELSQAEQNATAEPNSVIE